VSRAGSLRFLVLASLLFASAGRAWAQGQPAGGTSAGRADVAVRELTLDDVLAMAKKRNFNIAAERERVEQAQVNVSQAWATLLPTIAAQGKYTRNYAEFSFPVASMAMPGGGGTTNPKVLLIQPINQLDGVISFSAPLLVPAAYPGIAAVKANVRSQEATSEANDDSILFAVAQAFYAVGISDEVILARVSSIEVARATLENAKTRLTAGTVTKVDVDRAELALVRAEQLAREARYSRDQSYRSLATLAQIDTPFRVVVPPVVASAPPSEDLNMALQLRPEFRAIQESALAADKQRQTEALRWSPSISAFGNARKFNYDNFAFNRYSWAVGAQLDWVIFDGGARDALRKQAAAQEREAQARANALRDSIRDDLANGRSLLETRQHALEAATRSVELAKETINLVRTQYEAGSVTQVDLLQAQDALVGAQESLAQAHFDVAVADLALRRAAGTFPPR
jgi:outer membrane protein TolC